MYERAGIEPATCEKSYRCSHQSELTSRNIKRVILLIGLFGHSPLGNRKFSNQTRFMEASPTGRYYQPVRKLPLCFPLPGVKAVQALRSTVKSLFKVSSYGVRYGR